MTSSQRVNLFPIVTEARKESEDLKAQGSDKHAETRLEDLKHDLEKKIKDLDHKNKVLLFNLSCLIN